MGQTLITPEGWKTGLEEIAPKVFAYTQAHGELGVSNAGLLVDREGAKAIDTLMVPSAGSIRGYARDESFY